MVSVAMATLARKIQGLRMRILERLSMSFFFFSFSKSFSGPCVYEDRVIMRAINAFELTVLFVVLAHLY